MDVDNCIISPMLKMQEWRGEEEERGDSGGARGVGGGRETQGGGGRREMGGAKFRPKHSSNIECDVDADEQGSNPLTLHPQNLKPSALNSQTLSPKP